MTELRGLSVLASSKVVDPRVPFALALPFKSSTAIHVFHPFNMSKMFKEVTGRYFSRTVSFSRGVVSLPKILRFYFRDFEDWKSSAREIRPLASDPAISLNESSFGAGDKRVAKALAGSLSPDPRDRRILSSTLPKRLGLLDGGEDGADKSTEWDIAGQDRKYNYVRMLAKKHTVWLFVYLLIVC